MEPDNGRKIERRAKNMILSKDIPHSKMEAVRSLLQNSGLNSNEKYSAVIQLIQDCPDKPVTLDPAPAARINTDTTAPAAPQQTRTSTMTQPSVPASAQPTLSATYIDELYDRYRQYNLVKKRRLIYADNILKFWFKKRLVPNRRFYKIMAVIISCQEKVLLKLPAIMKAIVEDPDIEDPTVYNYLRALRKWMLDSPFVKLGYGAASWLDNRHFESELSNYIQYYFGFQMLDAELKEHIILTIENKCRKIEGAKNEDTTFSGNENNTTNLKGEKSVYAFMMLIRSFIPNPDAGKGKIDTYLASHVGTATLQDFLTVLTECLVFKRHADIAEIKTHFNAAPLVVNRKQWECSNEYLKKAGKDPESLRKHKLEQLKKRLAPYDGIVELIHLKVNGRDLLAKAFDEHWHIINNRRTEYGNYPVENYFYYLDDCINYFVHAYLPYLDGSTQTFVDAHKQTYESSIFSQGYFENRISRLSELQRALLDYRTENPNEMISHDEIQKILSGKLETMTHIQSFLSQIGALFYDFASELYQIYRSHQSWLRSSGTKQENDYRFPLIEGALERNEDPMPIPFFDCRIEAQEKMTPIQKTFVGKYIISDSVRDGLFKNIIAFCFQMAYECRDGSLIQDMANRRELRQQINLLEE